MKRYDKDTVPDGFCWVRTKARTGEWNPYELALVWTNKIEGHKQFGKRFIRYWLCPITPMSKHPPDAEFVPVSMP